MLDVSAPETGPAPTIAARRPTAIVLVLALGGIVVSLMQTLVIPLAPKLPKLLGASTADAAWVITATLLAAAVATPVVGRLGDMYGKRRMLLVSLGVLILGSILAALSDSLWPMIIARAMQGLAAGVIPLGISIMRDELPPERLGSSIALMSSSLGVGGALGLPAAAMVADHADWHLLFWISGGLGLIAAVLILMIVPESNVRSGGRFDLVGAFGLSAGLMCLLLVISKGADWGWSSPLVLGLIVAAILIFAAWGRWELRTPGPLVDLRTLGRRQVLLTNLASIAFGFAMFAMSLVFPQVLLLPTTTGYGLGQTMFVVGLVMAPSGLVMIAMAPVSARISKIKGPKITLMTGACVVAVAYGLSTILMSEIWHLVLVASLMGLGIGLAYGAMPALIMGAVPVSETAAANSLNTLMRSMGTSISSAVAGVLLAHLTVSLGSGSVPSQDGFRLILAIAGAASLAALGLAAFLPSQRMRSENA